MRLTDLPYDGIAKDFVFAGLRSLGGGGGLDVLDLGLGELLLGDGGLGDEFLGFGGVGELLEGFLFIGEGKHCGRGLELARVMPLLVVYEERRTSAIQGGCEALECLLVGLNAQRE